MYTFSMKAKYKDVEKLLDELMDNPYLIIKDKQKATRLGQIAKELRDKKVLHISQDPKLKETIAILKVNNAIRPDVVCKKKSKKIKYIFEDLLLPPPI